MSTCDFCSSILFAAMEIAKDADDDRLLKMMTRKDISR
jgi:hypothetical protein